MKFRFNIEMTESDYMDYNYFASLNMPAGKKQMRTMRAILWIAFAICLYRIVQSVILSWSIPIIPLAILILMSLWQIFLIAYIKFFVRLNVKRVTKSGKKPYSPHSVMEFYDDHFAESDSVSRMESGYAAVEKVSIIEGKAIYLHRDSVGAYVIPVSAFESDEQYRSFTEFISTKVASVQSY